MVFPPALIEYFRAGASRDVGNEVQPIRKKEPPRKGLRWHTENSGGDSSRSRVSGLFSGGDNVKKERKLDRG